MALASAATLCVSRATRAALSQTADDAHRSRALAAPPHRDARARAARTTRAYHRRTTISSALSPRVVASASPLRVDRVAPMRKAVGTSAPRPSPRRPRPAAAAASASSAPTASTSTSYRFVVVFLVALALLLCNADRVIMAVAGVPLAAANGWGARSLGLVQSSFLWGYALTPLLGGVLADRYGGKAVLGGGILLWSVATMLTPSAAAASLPALLACRAAMGLGEGVALPCMNNLVGRWVPEAERSRAVAACMGGFQSGSMVGLLAAPAMLAWGGVSGPFLIFGSAGVLWAVAWAAAATAFPARCARVSPSELALIEGGGAVVESSPGDAGKAEGKERAKVPFRLLLSKAPTWACIFANFVNNWGYFILLAWMPLYFKQVVGECARGPPARPKENPLPLPFFPLPPLCLSSISRPRPR